MSNFIYMFLYKRAIIFYLSSTNTAFILIMMDYYQDEQFLGRRLIPGITTDIVTSELAENPIVYKYWKKNPKEIQQRLIDTMMRIPSDSDQPGFIYGFRNLEEYDPNAKNYSIKMGRTKRQVPQKRIFQWERDDDHKYVQMFTIRSEYNMKLEALVHLVFAYARKTKVINGKNRIEWFTFDEKVPTAAVTNLLNLIMQKVHEKQCTQPQKLQELEKQQQFINQIISNQNQMLRQALQKVKRSISLYVKDGSNKCIDLFKLILDKDSLQEGIKIIDEILDNNLSQEFKEKVVFDIEQGKQQKIKQIRTQVKLLKLNLLKLKTTIKEIQGYETKYGLKFNYILGRVKEAIYFGLKGVDMPNSQESSSDFDQQLFEQIKQSNKNAVKQKIQSPIISSNRQKDKDEKHSIKLKNSQQESTASEIKHSNKSQVEKEDSLSEQLLAKQHLNKSKLSELFESTKDLQGGQTILNIRNGQFWIECNKNIRHNIIIVAKQIKVYRECKIKFSSDASDQKLHFIIIANKYVNAGLLTPPKKSQNGAAHLLMINEDGSFQGIDDYLKANPEKLKTKFFQGFKKIYQKAFK